MAVPWFDLSHVAVAPAPAMAVEKAFDPSPAAILTPTKRLPLVPTESGGSAGASSAVPASADPAPTAGDPFSLQLDVFAASAGRQSGGGLSFSAAGLPGAAGGAGSFSALVGGAFGGTSTAPFTLGSAGQTADALFAAVSAASTSKTSEVSKDFGSFTAIASTPTSSPTSTPTAPAAPNGGPSTPTSLIAIVPTEADPVVRSNPASFGGDPMSAAFSAAGVRYADGAVSPWSTDLSSDGFGMPWGQNRYWSNTPGLTAPGSPNGSGMADSQLPYLISQSSTVFVVTGGTSVRPFDLVGGNYVERYFLQDKLVDNTGAHEFDLTDTQGDVLRFNDSSGSPALLFKSFTDPYGTAISVVSYTGGQVGEVQRSTTVSGTTTTESYLYSYLTSPDPNAGKLGSVVERRKVGLGSWTTIRKAQYAYYVSSESHGNLGDLKTATIQNGSGSTIDTEYYRYYTGESGGYVHGLKYYFDAASYARLKAVYSNPTTATDAQAAPYSARYFEFDSSQRVTKTVVQAAGSSSSSGGLGTSLFSYTASGNSNDYNAWAEKTIETLNDSNTETVYTNYAGEVMLKVYHDTASGLNYDWFTQFDASGRVLMQAGPAAVTGYNDTYADLLHSVSGNYQYLSDSTGLIAKVDYYTSTTAGETTAGGVAGYNQDDKIVQGDAITNTATTLDATQYFQHTSSGISVDPVANITGYRNIDTTGGETTSYSYTWFTGTTQMQSVAVLLPVISSSQNGPGTADTATTFFDISARPIWTKNPDGFLNYTAYDPVTGAVIQTITDVDITRTGDFQNLPSGWTTPAGGGIHLNDQLTDDALGRSTSAVIVVNALQQGPSGPTPNQTYETYDDVNHATRIYRGWNSTTNTATGPTEVIRADRTNSYIETLTMTATPHVTGGVPDGTEAISGVQTLSRQYISAGGQDVADDKYFNLSGVTYSTSPHIGTSGTNYWETSYGYDSRGRLSTTTLPTNTVDTTNYDGLGRVTSTAVGTTTLSSTTTASYIYDNNTLGGSTAGGSAADRVTEQYYDWRDRVVATKSGVQTSEDTSTHRPIIFNSYDNLDEVTEVQQYDGDGVTITFTSGVPNAPSASLLRAQSITSFDDQRTRLQGANLQR